MFSGGKWHFGETRRRSSHTIRIWPFSLSIPTIIESERGNNEFTQSMISSHSLSLRPIHTRNIFGRNPSMPSYRFIFRGQSYQFLFGIFYCFYFCAPYTSALLNSTPWVMHALFNSRKSFIKKALIIYVKRIFDLSIYSNLISLNGKWQERR